MLGTRTCAIVFPTKSPRGGSVFFIFSTRNEDEEEEKEEGGNREHANGAASCRPLSKQLRSYDIAGRANQYRSCL